MHDLLCLPADKAAMKNILRMYGFPFFAIIPLTFTDSPDSFGEGLRPIKHD